MNGVGAWLLNLGGGQRAAVGLREVLHLAYAPQLAAIPQTPPHCSRVLVFGERLLPAWDLAAWLAIAAPGRAANLAAIVGYQKERRGPVQLGALLIAEPPARIMVSDENAADLPPTPTRWRAIAMSCFRHDDQQVPILDLRLMFSDGLSAGRTAAGPVTEGLAEIN